MQTPAQTLQNIFLFPYENNRPNGWSPNALSVGADGNFYGTTQYGGANSYGTFFRLTLNGVLTTLSSFNITNGSYPRSALVLAEDGLVYGMSYAGGDTGAGVIFRSGTSGNVSAFASFNGQNGGAALGPLALASDHKFYGSSYGGGEIGYGCVFSVTTNGNIKLLASSFSFGDLNGSHPIGAPLLAKDGYLYVPMQAGGAIGNGAITRVSTNGGGFVLMDTFYGTNGTYPTSSLTYGPDGELYGVTDQGGTNGGGVVYRFTTDHGINALVSLDSGMQPVGPMVVARDGNFYGTTYYGGSSGFGTVFQFTTQGGFTTVATFTNAGNPTALTLGPDGNLYGTAYRGPGGTTGAAFRFSLDPPHILSQPQSRTNHLGTLATFSVDATSLPHDPITYQWQKNGIALADANNVSGASTSQLTITGVSGADAAVYTLWMSNVFGITLSSNVVLTIDQIPYFSIQPTNQTIGLGGNITFVATAAGQPPLLFQWYFQNSPLGSPSIGTSNASYTITGAAAGQAGDYYVTVTDSLGTGTSTLAVLTVVQTPVITTQPSSHNGAAGKSTTFSVGASGIAPLSYNWKWFGTNLADGGQISGATTSVLTISKLNDTNAGAYSVTISNLAGIATSSNASLTIIDPPMITTQPITQRAGVGATVSLSVLVAGTAPFQYQWSFNNTSIPGANSGTYTIHSATGTNTGNYAVTVSNFAGTITSSNAVLSVLVPPALRIQTVSGYPVLNLSGLLGYNYFIQSSTNLAATNWGSMLTISNLASSPYQFLDPVGTSKPARYYRAVMQ